MAHFGDFMTQIRISISEVQLRQALSMISSQCTIDHKSAFLSATQMRCAPIIRQRLNYDGSAFWTSPQVQASNRADTSTSIVLKSTFHQWNQVRNFCVDVVEKLETNVVFQALTLDCASHKDSSLSFDLHRYVGANFEEDYLNILGDLLQRLKHVYIIANSEAMSPNTADGSSV
ncbi:hypothetical protein F4678DRAFT_456841 [Xylaria arbuscula]|nr:hypothetical protein F4678DRAFT_456841 [Xylaria arbuscula]